jgi:hypothetical protein
MKNPKTERGVSQLSDAPIDKLKACINQYVSRDPGYALHKDYFDALARWHAKLTPLEQETVLVVIDTFTHGHKVAAEGIAAMLPPAPKCPV